MIKQIQIEQQDNQKKQDHAQVKTIGSDFKKFLNSIHIKVHSYVTLYIKDVPVNRFGKQILVFIFFLK
jgi:hypothetical protein